MRKWIVIGGLACALVACSSGSSKADALIGAALKKVFNGIDPAGALAQQADENALLDRVRELVDYSSSQRDPKVPDPGQDIYAFGVAGVWMSQADLDRVNSDFPEGQGSIGTTFYASSLDLQPDWYAFAYVEFEADIPIDVSSTILQYAWVTDRDGDPSNNWQGQDPFDLDFFNGTDKWLQLVKAANETARLTMSDIDGTNIQEVESRARAIVCENALVYMVPMSEFGGRNFYPSGRFTSFWNITGDFGFNSGQWSGDDAPEGRTYDDLYNLDWSVTSRLAPVLQFDVRYVSTDKDIELDLGFDLGLSWNIDVAGDFGEGGVSNGHTQDYAFDWDVLGGGFNGHSLVTQDLQPGWFAPEVFDPALVNDKFSAYIRVPGDTGVDFETDPADRNTVSGVQFDGSIPYLTGMSPLNGQIRGNILSEQELSMKLPELESDPNVNVLTAPSLFLFGGQTGVIQHRNRTSAIDNFTASFRSTAESADSQLQSGDTGVSLILTPKIVNDRIDLTIRIGTGASFRATQDIQVNGATMGVHLPVIEAHDVQTRLTVDHGETIVLGGLLRDGQMTIEQGVPYLRDVPLISKALAATRDIEDTDKVIILVTPRLVNYND